MTYLEERGSVLLTDSAHAGAALAPVSSAATVRLSIAMAAHNEQATIRTAIERILAVDGPFELELIVVDDGSRDRTASIVESFDDARLKLVRHETNRGKGAAILTAAAVATGTHILMFDADLEYNAADIPTLVAPIASGNASIVYGARLHGTNTEFPSMTFALGGRATTVFTNVIFNSWMSDMHTCLKLIPLHLFRQLSLTEPGFGLDTEITCEILRRGYRPYEVPCSYKGRSVAEGKKISTRDGIECLKVAMQVRLRGRLKAQPLTVEPLHVVEIEEDTPEVRQELVSVVVETPALRVEDAKHIHASSNRQRGHKRPDLVGAGRTDSL